MPTEFSREVPDEKSLVDPGNAGKIGSSTFQVDWNRSRSGGDEVRHARGGCGRETQRQHVGGVDVCSSVPFRQGAIVLVPVKDAIAATAVAKRPSLTGPARGGVAGRQVGTKGWP